MMIDFYFLPFIWMFSTMSFYNLAMDFEYNENPEKPRGGWADDQERFCGEGGVWARVLSAAAVTGWRTQGWATCSQVRHVMGRAKDISKAWCVWRTDSAYGSCTVCPWRSGVPEGRWGKAGQAALVVTLPILASSWLPPRSSKSHGDGVKLVP